MMVHFTGTMLSGPQVTTTLEKVSGRAATPIALGSSAIPNR